MELITLQRGRTRATIAPAAGGRLLQLEIEDGGRWLRLLRAPRDTARLLAEPTRWGAFPMAPWPNRIDGGRFVWRGRLHELPRDGARHALHGRACYQPWRVDRASARDCWLSVRFDRAWPWGGSAVQQLRVLDDGIALTMALYADAQPFPAGCGWHPWFRRDVRPGRATRVGVDADLWYESDDLIPTGWLLRATGAHDLRDAPALGSRRLDTCYRTPRGPLRIAWGDVELTMTRSPNLTHAVVYTPARGVCVEPQTCAVDAFNLDGQGIAGAGTALVTPAQPLRAATIWRWRIVPPH